LNAVTLTVGLFVVAGFFVIVEWQHSEKSIFLAYLLYSGLMMGPVVRVSSFIPEYREYFLARDALRDAVLNAPHREQKLQSTDLITFSTADKRTSDQGPLEKLEIGPGDRIALIGASGSGKTTTIEALLGAREGVLGTPLISHHPSHSVRLELPHAGVRYLTETPVFEMGTILMNCQTTLAECQRIASMFGLYPGMNDNALVSFFGRSILPSGEPLSLGERQRVQFVRALATKPKALNLGRSVIWN
jgi:ABC-type bacteriocin/lantibiotic exporter with double-glycine peptidase domain